MTRICKLKRTGELAACGAALVVTWSAVAGADDYDELVKGGAPPAVPATQPGPPAAATAELAPPPQPERAKVPAFSVEGTFRQSFNLFVAGKAAGRAIGEVFGPAYGFELDLGFRLGHVVLLYGGWERTAWGVGDLSPYARMSSSSAWSDQYIGGIRLTTGTGVVAAMFDISGAYSKLQQQGSSATGKASIAFPSPMLRLGVGLSVRPARWVSIEPSMALYLATIESYTSEISVIGAPTANRDGSLTTGSLRLSISPGAAVNFGIPFTRK